MTAPKPTREKPKVGQILWVLDRDRRRGECELIPATVVKIGRKYLHVRSDHGSDTFSLSDWRHTSGPYGDSRLSLYESEQEWRDECEHDDLREMMRRAFDWGGFGRKLSLKTLREINRLIADEIEQKEKQ